MTAGSQEWACLPSPCILQVFCLAESSKDALAWRLACKSFHAVCGKVDMLKLRVLGDAKAAVSELDSSAGDFSTWFGLDLDFAPMELVQQHLHAGVRWARLAEPASFCLPYHLHKLAAVVTLELVLNPAVEEVVFASAAFLQLHSLRRLTFQGRLPQHRRRVNRRALPHLSRSVMHLAAHGLNITATDWCHFRHIQTMDLSHSDVRFGPYCGALLHNLSELVLRSASLELSSPALFEDMLRLRRLDMQGCTSSRTGSWLSRVLGSNSDVVALPEGLVSLQAIGCNVFDKCVLELGAATGLQLLEVSSSVQLPATLKHAAHGAVLGLHIAEEGQVVTRHGRDNVSVKACLVDRLAAIRRLSGWGLGRSTLGVVGQMGELRELCLLGGERRRLELELELPAVETVRVEGYQIIQLRLPVCLSLHTVVLSGHGVCQQLALPPSTRVLVLDNVMRDARALALSTMVPRLKTVVLGIGHLPASLPATVERLAVVGEPRDGALGQAYAGLQALLPQLPNLKELRVSSGEALLPEAVAALLPAGCQFSTAGVPRKGAGVDCWGRSLHQTAQLSMEWCESLVTTEGLNLAALEAGADSQLARQISRVLVS
ncbi:hypothetical protein CHLNCDRAFT_57172 [Chlorella variabilis]|uniref:Uncharacterized protein n=1 Tax=Chlorella variabilis TaxID=554065 RepID=E1Z8I1_CHLVA|nr:hypothetical protein CHLNCDRAFT_57172 [Chlorella variabilis]EFN57614.1 hypothetical protein CHLNCDRAFT_57172 [Chlorella variabilis]|eukprot:XP_005849716.1 hypothetical protein CHLNCDRAFT_57172 [Chlorella variabilis]